jgi:hypothetical protein
VFIVPLTLSENLWNKMVVVGEENRVHTVQRGCHLRGSLACIRAPDREEKVVH